MFYSEKILNLRSPTKKTASFQILPAFARNDVWNSRLSRKQTTTRTSLIPAGRRPFTLRSALAIAMGRASESLMRPAVGRHHRSSRALTQDASTLWDLLIFEIARPGMFIWRRGCRRDSPASRSSSPLPPPPPTLSSNLPADISQLLPPRARRGIPFFSSYVSVLRAPPFLPSSRRRRLSSSAEVPTEKNAITPLNERGRIPRLVHPTSHVATATSRLHHTSDSRTYTYSRNSSFIVL